MPAGVSKLLTTSAELQSLGSFTVATAGYSNAAQEALVTEGATTFQENIGPGSVSQLGTLRQGQKGENCLMYSGCTYQIDAPDSGENPAPKKYLPKDQPSTAQLYEQCADYAMSTISPKVSGTDVGGAVIGAAFGAGRGFLAGATAGALAAGAAEGVAFGLMGTVTFKALAFNLPYNRCLSQFGLSVPMRGDLH